MRERHNLYVEAVSASPCWRITHIMFSCVAAIGSLTAIVPFSLVVQKFGGSCPLYARLEVQHDQVDNTSFAFTENSIWDRENICSYCLFTSVSSFIYSFIWLWFFIVCASERTKSMSSLLRPWLVVPPAIVFNFVMTVLIFVASGYLTSGVNLLCEQLDNSIVKGCSRAQEVKWTLFKLHNFYTLLVVCQAAMWISSFAWLFGFVALLLRCCTGSDFKVVQVSAIYVESSQETLSTAGPSSI